MALFYKTKPLFYHDNYDTCVLKKTPYFGWALKPAKKQYIVYSMENRSIINRWYNGECTRMDSHEYYTGTQ